MQAGPGRALGAALAAIFILTAPASSVPPYHHQGAPGFFDDIVTQAEQLSDQVKAAPPAQKPALEKKLEQTVDKIDTRADTAPRNPKVQVAAAQAFLKVDAAPRAARRADQAVRLAPRDPEARVVRAQVSYALKDYARAAEDARVALELDPGNADARMVLRLTAGRVEGSAGVPATAAAPVAGSAAAPAAFPGWAPKPAFSDAELAAEAERQRTAARAALAADRGRVEGLVTEASSRMKLGDRDGAGQLIDRALAFSPSDGRLHALKALTLLRPGADALTARAALAEARQGVAAAPRSATAQVALARALEAAGASPDEVLAAYQAAAEADPAFASEYAAALERRKAGQPAAEAPSADASAATGGSAPNLLFGRLADAARRGWPWLSVAAGLAFAAWSWLAKRQLS